MNSNDMHPGAVIENIRHLDWGTYRVYGPTMGPDGKPAGGMWDIGQRVVSEEELLSEWRIAVPVTKRGRGRAR